ncbi:MAG: hypothetical protein LC795_09815 [Acidobacteria bacterium]|nr:hypothetical protein [Acidobacteriota bacterium]MCA1619586.1 hypothetical protein [Acidobacteriota bacterium]
MAIEPPFEATTHLVAHLLRETESALRDVLESFMDRSERLDKKGKPAKPTHEDEIRAILKGLEIPETDATAEAWLRLPGRSGYGLHARAHRDDLARPRPVNQEYRQFWGEMEAILDTVLEKFESRYLESHRTLDALLAVTNPTRADAQRLRLNVPNNLVAFGYFFRRLNNPAWLGPLWDEGLFRHPSEPEVDTEKGTIGFPSWPQSHYLARMAAASQPDVQRKAVEIALQIETENVSIHEDLMAVALAVPAEMAVELVRKEAVWVERQRHIFALLPEKLGAAISHLALGGQVDAALDFARCVLAILSSPRGAERDEDNPWALTPDPVARVEAWDYEQILDKDVPVLVAVAGERALTLLCDLLQTAISLSRGHGEEEKGEDFSYIWSPDLDDNQDREVKDLLVQAVRKASEQLASQDAGRVPGLVNTLEGYGWAVFNRLALHLLRFSPAAAGDLIAERLTNRANYENTGLWHEYILLARDHFNNLPEQQRELILGWIDEGPSVEEVKEGRESLDGTRLTDEQAVQNIKRRKLRRLKPLRDVLPPPWREQYDEWVRETEEPEHAEYVTPPIEVRWGLESPQSTEDLRPMSVEEIVALLRAWQPSESPMGPAAEGLGQQLTPLVTSEPARFASEAEKFCGLDPTYVRALLSGLRDAVKHPSPLSWSPVLALCHWVVEQPREIPGRENQPDNLDRDKDWGWSRGVIAELLSAGFQSGTAEVPFDLRNEAWVVLRPLADDPEPTPEYEERYGGSNMDPFTLSLNTVRGKALHAVVEYARWVDRHVEAAASGAERAGRGFDEMPEVREVLDSHLDPELDPSLAIRAVYGQWLPWLDSIDHRWASQNKERIYPANEAQTALWNAAWDAYIRSVKPYDTILELLRDEYTRAVEHICEEPADGARRPQSMGERLVHHLTVFYGRGKLELDDPEGLLAKFYRHAPDRLRAQALWVMGRGLQQVDSVPPEVLERSRHLCEHRIEAARSSGSPGDYKVEMKAVGWLFASLKFDDAWALTQLRSALEVSGEADPDREVVQRLAALAPAHPITTVECLGMMVDGDKEGWRIRYWGILVRNILAAARQSDDATAQQSAAALINRLGARGFIEFQDLL